MRYPETANIYSINEGNYQFFPEGVKNTLNIARKTILQPLDPIHQDILVQWWLDFHRNLIKGGIFFIPEPPNSPKANFDCSTNVTRWLFLPSKLEEKLLMVSGGSWKLNPKPFTSAHLFLSGPKPW
jgi:fructose-1,6-bisphosphatase I